MPQKILSTCLLTKFAQCSVRRVAVHPSYTCIWVARWLEVNTIIQKVRTGNKADVARLKAGLLFT